MYHLSWVDHDGTNGEECEDLSALAKRLLKLARKEANNNYGTCVVSVTKGVEVSYEYIVDEANGTEKIMIDGDTMLIGDLPPLRERIDVGCPKCGCDAGYQDDVGVKIDGEYVSLIHYECSECGMGFYI